MEISYELFYADPVKALDVTRVASLIKRLSPDRAFSDDELLESMRENQYFVARNEAGNIIAVATLVTSNLPGNKRARLEDVIVDSAYRGEGIGRALMDKVIWHVRATGYSSIDLSSKPTRKAANALYQSMGFRMRNSETNFYRLDL
jgi:ribosomal protein S18 acetylase RimI-like enzyme